MSDQTKENPPVDIRSIVRDKYGQIAEKASSKKGSSCCGGGPNNPDDLIRVEQLYKEVDTRELPSEVTGLSLGCGDPVTLASLTPGQTVLDLGSGGGIDCFLAAKQVGPNGRVIGVDMTPAMLEQARRNNAKIGAENVEFRLGEIEHLPVPDASVDVIISNCVINLSPDKPQVFREAFRALKPGGYLAVSDIVTDGPLPEEIKQDLSAWAGCVAGALDVKDYIAAIEEAGFIQIELTPEYMNKETIAEAAEQLDSNELKNLDRLDVQKTIYSAKVKAWKPEK